MKKYLLSIAALLLGLLAHSQEADDLGKYAEISIIPRVDLSPAWYTDEVEFTLGSSSLYTLFEGSASEHFSWTVVNHWFDGNSFLGRDADPFVLFKTLGYSDSNNFIDMLYADLKFGGWTFTLGKQCITTGGHEYDDWDWLVHGNIASPLWRDLACYQWGGKVAWTTPSENTTFSLQMVSSPFGERPFASGLFTYSLQWSGDYGWYSPLWSVSAFAKEAAETSSAPRDYSFVVSLGNKFTFGDWTVSLDWSNVAGLNYYYTDFLKGCIFHGQVDMSPSDRWEFSLRGNYVFSKQPDYSSSVMPQTYTQVNYWNIGPIVHFYPLRDSKDLRLHASALLGCIQGQPISALELSIGVLYNLNFRLW